MLLCLIVGTALVMTLILYRKNRAPEEEPRKEAENVPAGPENIPPEITEAPEEEPVPTAPEYTASLQETDIYTFLQGPKAWGMRADWSGSWCRDYLAGQEFSVFGCGLCNLANLYGTLTDHDCSPLDMFYYAKEVSNYTPVSGVGAIDWTELKQTLHTVGIECELRNKDDTYEEFQKNVLVSGTVIALISSYNDSTYWQDVEGHYVNLWLYDQDTDTVLLADSGNPEHNRQRIPLRYVYDALKTGAAYQYLAVTGVDKNADTWQHNGIHTVWQKPSYYTAKTEELQYDVQEPSVSQTGRLSMPPYVKVETAYTEEARPGTIRYVQQNILSGREENYFYADYWDPLPNGDTECYAASISMALSYIGISRTAGTIVAEGRLVEQPGAEKITPSFQEGIDNFLNGGGTYSPVVLHIKPYAGRAPGNEHWVVISGKVSDDTYRILDPIDAEHGYTWDAVIHDTQMYYWDGCEDSIYEVYQYKLP